jgi:hypothetical protein
MIQNQGWVFSWVPAVTTGRACRAKAMMAPPPTRHASISQQKGNGANHLSPADQYSELKLGKRHR